MTTHRKSHNIKSNRRRQLKHLLLSGNRPAARKHKITRQITQETTDYSKLGWKVFTDWDKHRYVLPSELEEYNITNLRRRSLLGGPTFGIRTSVDDGRPLGHGTQAPQCESAPNQKHCIFNSSTLQLRTTFHIQKHCKGRPLSGCFVPVIEPEYDGGHGCPGGPHVRGTTRTMLVYRKFTQ